MRFHIGHKFEKSTFQLPTLSVQLSRQSFHNICINASISFVRRSMSSDRYQSFLLFLVFGIFRF